MARKGPAYYRSYAAQQARQQGIPVNIFLNQIGAEAGWRTGATSHAGARGIAQIMPFHDVDPNRPGKQVSGVDPLMDLRWAARHNAQNLRKYGGSVRDMLSVYNSGRPWSQGKNITETNNYVKKIMGGGPGQNIGNTVPFEAEAPARSVRPSAGIKSFLMQSLADYANTGRMGGSAELYAAVRASQLSVPDEFEDTPQTPYGSIGRGGQPPLPRGKGITWGGEGKHTHETSGLAGYPARDLFAKPGTPFVAPESGQIYRHSGRGGTSGGVYGKSIYFRGQSGKDYFITHLGSVAPKGRYRRGQTLGTVSPWKSGSPHAHVGVRGR